MADLPSGTVTFLFTDIEGSTRLLKQLRDRWGEVLAEHQRLLRAAFEEAGGHEIDTQGDSFFVAFRSAKDAVAAAVAAQRALAAHDWPDDLQLRVRMGIHTGEPTVGSERYVGLGVHRAARIMAAGHGGQVLLSQSTRAVLEDDELHGALVRDLGEWQLKDLDRPEHIYQLEIDGLDNEFPPLKTLEGQPEQATPFEGREGELAEAAWRSFVPRGLRSPRRAYAVAVGAAAATLGATLFFVFGSGSSQALSSVNANALGLISAKGNRLTGQVDVGASPSSVAIGHGSAWVTNVDEQTVSRIDLASRSLRQTIPVGHGPSAIAADSRWVWVANSLDGTVSQIDPQATGNEVVQTIPVGSGPAGIAVGPRSIWVTNKNDGTVSRIDPRKVAVTKIVKAGAGASGIAVGAGAVWVANEVTGTLSRIDPSGKAGTQTIAVGNGPNAVAFGADAIWVANSLDGTVMRVDPVSDTVRATIPIAGASGITASGDAVWVSDEFGGTVSRIDPKSDHIVRRIQVGNRPGGLAAVDGDVFVTVRAAGRTHRGGTLRLLANAEEFDSIDPSRAYRVTTWSILSVTNDGLIGFKRVGGNDGTQLVPDLAVTLPAPSADGKTYTFHLRPNLHFSTGAPVTPLDILKTFERSFQPAESGPTFYSSIVGAATCARNPERCDFSRGIVTDNASRTVTFHLTAPDPDFLYKLALPAAFVVPAGSPNGETQRPLPATGPYMIASYKRPREVKLVRNPRFHEWSKTAQPEGAPDRIDWNFRLAQGKQVTAVERASADGVFGMLLLPPAQLREITTQFASQVHVSPSPRTNFLVLNTRVPPFNDIRVRRALSYAIDRQRSVESAGGPEYGQPTCQLMPPSSQGFRRYCPFTLNPSPGGFWTAPDLAKAEQLVRASGTRGMRVTFWSGPHAAMHKTALLSLLRLLGYKTQVRSFSSDQAVFSAFSDPRHKAQITVAGWVADYPAPSQFSQPLLSCSLFVPGSQQNANLPEFCNAKIDSEIKRALRLQLSDPGAATELWTRVDHDIVDQAPLVPLTNRRTLDFVSRRVENYQYNPQWGALIDQLWVR